MNIELEKEVNVKMLKEILEENEKIVRKLKKEIRKIEKEMKEMKNVITFLEQKDKKVEEEEFEESDGRKQELKKG